MRYQHRHIVAKEEDSKKEKEKKNSPKKKYGIITVSIGEGLDTVLRN